MLSVYHLEAEKHKCLPILESGFQIDKTIFSEEFRYVYGIPLRKVGYRMFTTHKIE